MRLLHCFNGGGSHFTAVKAQPKPEPVFEDRLCSCDYCKKAPDLHQKEARCTSCGAALRVVQAEEQKAEYSRLKFAIMAEKHKLQNEMYHKKYDQHDADLKKRKEEDEARRKRQEDDESYRKRSNEDSQRAINLAMGDSLNSGIPGGYDGNMSTPL